LNVPADTPELGHGEMLEKPMPAPNATSTSVRAAVAIPPAITADQATADCSAAMPTEVSVLPLTIAPLLD
jgi:hypothetical protein